MSIKSSTHLFVLFLNTIALHILHLSLVRSSTTSTTIAILFHLLLHRDENNGNVSSFVRNLSWFLCMCKKCFYFSLNSSNHVTFFEFVWTWHSLMYCLNKLRMMFFYLQTMAGTYLAHMKPNHIQSTFCMPICDWHCTAILSHHHSIYPFSIWNSEVWQRFCNIFTISFALHLRSIIMYHVRVHLHYSCW